MKVPRQNLSRTMFDHLEPIHLLNIVLSAVMLVMIPMSTDPRQRIARCIAFAGWGASIVANLIPLSVLALGLSMIGGGAHLWAAFSKLAWLRKGRGV